MPTLNTSTTVKTIEWIGGMDGHARLIDQTQLPAQTIYLDVRNVETMWQAIRRLQIRGAPAIGVAAAYGCVLGIQSLADNESAKALKDTLRETSDYLATSRPTAVNLFWALQRMQRTAQNAKADSAGALRQRLLQEAEAIREEDAAMCRAIGRHGAGLIADGTNVLTHCNAGGLATAEYGTALAVLFTAHETGKTFHVYVDETRPLLQGARLTAWELQQARIDATLVCDNMAGHLMQAGQVDLVITGADRIAANGDAANKIGTYSLAVLAHAHNLPFYIAAPSSTFDLNIPDGSAIPIEQRDADEITAPAGWPAAPEGINVYNPAFDVTPALLIAGIITEKGIIYRPNTEKISDFFSPS